MLIQKLLCNLLIVMRKWNKLKTISKICSLTSICHISNTSQAFVHSFIKETVFKSEGQTTTLIKRVSSS